jgi:hypothetical protein
VREGQIIQPRLVAPHNVRPLFRLCLTAQFMAA